MTGARCAVRLAACVFALVAATARPAEGCSCRERPLCESFWTTPVVFSGTVMDVEGIQGRRAEIAAGRSARIQVDQVWRGSLSGVVEVHTGIGGGDCGLTFIRGEKYLVYARDESGRLSTNICTRTRRLAEAGEDLAYLKSAFQPSVAGRVFGTVRRQGPSESTPVSGYVVTLRSSEREWRTTTTATGEYQFRVPAGKYRLDVAATSTEHVYGVKDIELADPRGCASEDFMVVSDGRIATRVVEAGGTPATGITIEFVRLETIGLDRSPETVRAMVDGDGRVEAPRLNPDRYVIGVNVISPPDPSQPYPRTFYPGTADIASARVVDLGAGERVELEPFHLPRRFQEHRISGSVRWPDGRPVPGASVVLLASTDERRLGLPAGTSSSADAAGQFTLVGLTGHSYRVQAFVNVETSEPPMVQWSAISRRFEAGTEEGPVVLTLAPPSRR